MNSNHIKEGDAIRSENMASHATSVTSRQSEYAFGERTLHFVAQSCSVPEKSATAIGECTINTRNLQIADAIATYRKLAPKSTI
jgi:hypothetical protein